MSVNAVMAQTFLPGVTNRNTGMSRREIQVFDPQVWHDTWQVYKLVTFLGKVGVLTGSFLQENCKFIF